MELGNKVDQLHDISTLQLLRKNIAGTFFFDDLPENEVHVGILPVVQQVNRPAAAREQQADVLPAFFGKKAFAERTYITAHTLPGKMCDHILVPRIDNNDHGFRHYLVPERRWRKVRLLLEKMVEMRGLFKTQAIADL